MNHTCSNGGEGVVVAKFDFLSYLSDESFDTLRNITHRDGQRIVLINYWDHSHVQELDERILSIQVLRPLKDLSNRNK